MSPGALVLLDEEAARWWAAGGATRDPAVPSRSGAEVFCGSLRSWAVLEKADAERGVRWLGCLGEEAWAATGRRLADWHETLAAIAPIPPMAPVEDPLAELLGGDLATPALLSLALLPAWAGQLAPFSPVHLPVGRSFRPPRFAHAGDLPLHVLAAVLRQRGQEVVVTEVLPSGTAAGGDGEVEGWSGAEPGGATWLTIGKLRHPDVPLVALEAAGLPVVLFEPRPAPPLPELFAPTPRCRCHPRLDHRTTAATGLSSCPEGGAEAGAAAWLERLRRWPPLVAEGQAIGRERRRLDRRLSERLDRSPPALVMVPEENDLSVERLLGLTRRRGVPHAVMHHTAEVLPGHRALRWQRHLKPGDPRLVPLRGQRRDPADPTDSAPGAVLCLDPVRVHLLDALELEGPLAPPQEAAVGWLHYPLLQQALVPLADPLAYWQAVNRIQAELASQGVSLLLARKPPLEPTGLNDARAQGLGASIPCLPLAELLARSQVVIAPGHIGTGHLEAMARGRAVVVVSPDRLRRPSLLLDDPSLPLPRLHPDGFGRWWQGQNATTLARLAEDQTEWLRGQVVTTASLVGWLEQLGVAVKTRPQRFLGSGLMAHQPLLERVEAMGRLARRLQRLRSTRPGRLLVALHRGVRR